MNKLCGLVKRNLLVYFKNRTAVFFSILTPIIVLVLYILFLKGNYVSAISSASEGLRDFIDEKDIEALANGILLVGILGSALITIPFNALAPIVRDKETQIYYDVAVTPISRVQIVLGYFIAASVSAFILSALIMTAGILVISVGSPMYMSAADIVYLYLTILIGSVSATAILMCVMLFLKNSSESSAFMGIVSAASGFVIGAYIPISEFSEAIQTFCHCLPATGVTVVIRNLCLSGVLAKINDDIGGVDGGAFVTAMRSAFTFNGRMFGNDISLTATLVYIVVLTLVAIVAISIIYPKMYRKR